MSACRTLLLLVLVIVSARVAQSQVKRVTRPLLRPMQYHGTRFSPSLKWRVTIGMTADTTPALADLDLDGTMDIVVPGADGNLYRLTAEGNVKWKVALSSTEEAELAAENADEEEAGASSTEGAAEEGDVAIASRGSRGVTLGDADRDGDLDILVVSGKNLLCFGDDGKEQWGAELSEPIGSLPTVADIDADGDPEVIFGGNDNKLHVLTGKGEEKWSFETQSWIVGGVAVSDLEGDGRLEVVFGSMDFNVYCLSSAGKLVWKFETGDWVQSSPCIADVDRDGGKDVVVVSDDGNIFCLSRRGTLKWKEALSGPRRTKAYLAVADLDGEGTLETIVCPPGGNLQVYTAFGDRAWARGTGGEVRGSPLIADLNRDGWQDILIATQNGRLLAFDTWGGTHWNHYLGHTIEATPALADVDRDGKYEIYVANLIPPRRAAGFLSQYEITVGGGRGLWTTIKGDPYRTGYGANAADYAIALRRGNDYATAWEPFLAGFRPRTGLQPPRRLRIAALPIDDVEGNRDGALDPGETALLKVQVTNEGSGASYDSLLSVSFGKSSLKLDRTRMYLGWIAPKATKTSTFRVTAPPPTKGRYGSSSYRELVGNATARMELRESMVLAAISEARVMKVPPLPPLLRTHQWQIIDGISALTFGNGNGRLDSGETVILRSLIQNDSLTTAGTATASLTSNNADVLVATPAAILRKVVPFGGRRVDFGLRVARQLAGGTATLRLTVRALDAPLHVDRFTVPLRQLPVDTTPPRIVFASISSRLALTRRERVVIAGMVSDAADLGAFRFEKQPVPVSSLKRAGPNRYRFSFDRHLKVGENVFPITATDTVGNSTTQWVRLVRVQR